MISVEEAIERIERAFAPLGAELVSLDRALGRVLAEPLEARLTQPPADVSAMDGYAVRAADVKTLPVRLKITQRIAAGQPPSGAIGDGEAARIFTGAQVPPGADTIVIQENCDEADDHLTVREGRRALGQHIRKAGLDFATGDIALHSGRRLTARDISLAAAMNRPWLTVRRRPRIALLSTGDELVNPGDPVGPAQIIGSNGIGLAAMVHAFGGEPVNLGIARDNLEDLDRAIETALGFDALVTSGGASVGEHDLVQTALTERGMQLDFWKIAMRPGKPLMFGALGALKVLGLPGNPVSSIVTALLFLKPAIERMLGLAGLEPAREVALLGKDMPANDTRQDYVRARLVTNAEGQKVATPFSPQDSAMLSLIARADCLIVRKPHAPAAKAGDTIDIIPLSGGCLSI
ncbi:molybdopterin molybdotransferase MoeA [Dongia deserti]|uniref:molybdopterin molybdotransferase MoeA n=1 Tax=Dongia deserti TaxID=2268030 RepID=UPI000E65E102|nr:gephyrin-like molybdotransferase Glp [Dongia deserti]